MNFSRRGSTGSCCQTSKEVMMLDFRLTLIRVLYVVRLVADFMRWTIGIFLSAATADHKEDERRATFGQGVLNYRTGQLDNGLDPSGWYELD